MNYLLSFSSVMKYVGFGLIAFLVLLLTITVHEFGHYIVGKIFKFKINEFSIGMGPKIYKKVKRNGELFCIRCLPLGGFCAFEGEDEDEQTINQDNKKAEDKVFEEISEQENQAVVPQKTLSKDAFNNKKPYQRILVLIAGASVNFLFALILVFINFACFGNFAIEAYEMRAEVSTHENSLQSHDIITSIDGKYLYMATDIPKVLANKKKGDVVTLDIVRDGKKMTIKSALLDDVGESAMGDYSASFRALGFASVFKIVCDEGSKLSSNEYVYRIGSETFEEAKRVYDLQHLAQLLSEYPQDASVFVWQSDKASGEKVLQSVKLDGDWSEKVNEYKSKIDADEKDAYKSIVKDYLKISGYSFGYQANTQNVKMSFGELMFRPLVFSFKTIGMTFEAIGQIFTGKLSLKTLSGPISTVSITSEYVQTGFGMGFGSGLNFLLEIASFIGLSVAIFNLLPLPALDGGRVVFVAIEWVRGKPINRKIEGMIHAVGLIVLFAFAILVDLLKLF